MNTYEIIKLRINEKRLYRIVKEISSYHRIQASTTYRQAVEHVCELAQKYHLDCKVLKYEANPEKWYLENKMFQEWNIVEATLDLVEPEIRLCDYSAEPISVIQKSYPCDYRETPLDLVFLDKGSQKEYYNDLDLNGKMVFTHCWFNEVDWAFDKGALGIVSDAIREDKNRSRHDLYDSLSYMSFWHDHDKHQKEVFGFVLSPRMGDKLAELCLEAQKENKYIKVKPYINSSLYNGSIEVIEITIPGLDDKTVMLSAHLCHPSSSANDNASGVAATLETMHVLQELIDEGIITKPQHTIKLTLIPEFTGTFAYLSDHNHLDIIGAINLDMVGAKQDRTNGPITLTKMPLAHPSLVNEIATWAMNLANNEATDLGGESIALTNHRISDFSGGSDHTIYADMTIGYGGVMLGQWPDRNYHTSTDTLDKIDPAVLKYSTLIATYFAYNLANISCDDLQVIVNELINNMNLDFTKTYRQFLSHQITKEYYDAKINKYIRYYLDSLMSITKILDVDQERLQTIQLHIQSLGDTFKALTNVENIHIRVKDTRVYQRNFIGPINNLNDYKALGYEQKINEFLAKKPKDIKIKEYELNTLIPYYIDGMRTVDEIKHEVSVDFASDVSTYVDVFLELLEKINLIHLK